MTNKTLLILGGAGYIGSYVNKLLCKAGYATIIVDDLSSGYRELVKTGTFIEGDFGDEALLTHIFSQYQIDGVLHFAAFKSVNESIENPKKYYSNNVIKTITLLNTMLDFGIKKFIFSSSAAVYGTSDEAVVTEETPCHPCNVYGTSKLFVEKILQDYGQAYNLDSISLRYFNVAGGDPDGELCHSFFEAGNLIPIALTRLVKNETITVYGTDYDTPDGSCLRDYIHLHDLATAHIAALEKVFLQAGVCTSYNLGTNKGYSVLEVLDTIKKVTHRELKVELGPRRSGDPAQLIANASRAEQELSWKTQMSDITKMVSDTWKCFTPPLEVSVGA